MTIRNSRIVAIGMALSLAGSVAGTSAWAMLPADGGAGSAETAKAKRVERHREAAHRVSHPISHWAPVARRSHQEEGRMDRRTGKWSGESEAAIKADIHDYLHRHHGNVTSAWHDSTKQRAKRKNWYDRNLAAASDYLRARHDVDWWREHGKAGRARAYRNYGIDAYLDAKKHATLHRFMRRGSGPVSPYSQLERKYMLKGADDGFKDGGHQNRSGGGSW
ncbi:MAG TPA: hypothetical protein VH855_03055 [Acetobacteraceae bacterium]|jgi:hypothetical protein